MPIQSRLSATNPPVRMWLPLEETEKGAVDQLINAGSLPFVKQVCAMPDTHVGFGVPIGCVLACQGAVAPASIGVDIGCGMAAIQIDVDPDQIITGIDQLRHSITRSIPTGFNVHKEPVDHQLSFDAPVCQSKADIDMQKVDLQRGTLGSGNHFIEICLDENRNVWVMLHSGSRNAGLKIANYYTKVAKEMMKTMFITLPDPELSYLPEGTESFLDYWKDLSWAQHYAMDNREQMIKLILKDIRHFIGKDFETKQIVNCHHNFAARENHNGQNYIVVRKGAISAKAGELGIIPGSMGAKSYIVEGLGNPESFNSSSHGAGRRMGRNVAKNTFTREDLEKSMVGISYDKDANIIDEIAGAYKDLDKVMEYQNDLVKPIHTLKQIMSIKGSEPERKKKEKR